MYRTIVLTTAALLTACIVFAETTGLNSAIEKFKNKETRYEAIQEIESIGVPAAEELKKLINDERIDQTTRSYAIMMLGRIKSEDDRMYLEQIFTNDNNINNRDSAGLALGYLGDKQSIPALTNGLQDKSSRVCMRAAWALAELGDNSGRDLALTAIKKGRNAMALMLAVDALEAMNDKTIITRLKENLKNPNPNTRRYSMIAIKRLEAQSLSSDDKRNYLKEMLKDRQPEITRWAAFELVKDGSTEAADILKETARDVQNPAGSRSSQDALQILVEQGKLNKEDLNK